MSTHAFVVTVLAAALFPACTPLPAAASPKKAAGFEGGPCFPNATCHNGLSCLSSLCVNAGAAGAAVVATSCADLLKRSPGAASGVRSITPGGSGSMSAYCDMTTDGGGWTLVANYTRAAGSKPTTLVRDIDLPLLEGQLGANEQGTVNWGHAGTAMMSRLTFTEVRLLGQTTNHSGSRMMHFKTSLASVAAYYRTGIGDLKGIQHSFTPLAGHTAKLPASATHFTEWGASLGNDAMIGAWGHGWTNGDDRAWALGQAGWCVDDGYDNGCGTDWDTVHRVFVR